MMKQMVLLGCMCASFVLSAADGGKAAENLNRLPGTKLSADSVLYKYTADKAADGDRTDKLSRWVSRAEAGEAGFLDRHPCFARFRYRRQG